MTTKLEFSEVHATIKEMVKEQLGLDQSFAEIEDGLLFGTASGFDSTTLLEFILALEEHFDIIIPDEDLDLNVFGSISEIANYIIRNKE